VLSGSLAQCKLLDSYMSGQTKTPRGAARENILRAALELFSVSGVRAVGLDAVAERAGVAKVTLFRHFPTKADLVVDVLAKADALFLESYRAAMRRGGDEPAARILALFDGLDDLARKPGYRGCLFINTGLALADDDHPAHELVARHKQALRELLADELRSAGHPEPDAASDQLLLLVDGALVAGALRPAGRPARDARALAEGVLARCPS
jgi:AcrR family transcriptional regulator